MESRRLQLVVEKSHVTGILLRKGVRKVNITACSTRWQIRPVRSQLRPGMPGVGHPRWRVELLKVKNGYPGSWTVEWKTQQFQMVQEAKTVETIQLYA